ncbi:MAG TPA: TerB family tellurite resistance protein [Longimicrobiales bacterium]|nr:TerB family tellurite resistance protein [Longimicrobiales bacterium]
MLDAIREFFRTSMQPSSESDGEGDPAARGTDARNPDVRMAACALMLELAWADDEFSDEEREHLESAVRRHWGLEEERADELIRVAEQERRQATDLFQFTRLIRQHYSLGQKMVLAEILWGLVYADGDLSSREDYLMRKISSLLDLKVAYLSEARNRAREGGAAPDGPFVVD